MTVIFIQVHQYDLAIIEYLTMLTIFCKTNTIFNLYNRSTGRFCDIIIVCYMQSLRSNIVHDMFITIVHQVFDMALLFAGKKGNTYST